MVLTPTNVQALRTLFNIAYRLHHLLGAAWNTVLENLNALDRILESPSTTTQVLALGTGTAAALAAPQHALCSHATPVDVALAPPQRPARVLLASGVALGAGRTALAVLAAG